MAISSINVQGASSGAEGHNLRESRNLYYVRDDLSEKNETYITSDMETRLSEIKQRYAEKVKQKWQKNTLPIREAVVNFNEYHTIEDFKSLAKRLEVEFGIKTFHIAMHRDEGAWQYEKNDQGEKDRSKPMYWKPNYHAHMLIDYTDHSTGKMIRFQKSDLQRLQDVVANGLAMERGTGKHKRLEAVEYKQKEIAKDIKDDEEYLKKLHGAKQALPEALNILEQARLIQENIERLKENEKALKFGLEYAKNKANSEIQKLEEKKEELGDFIESYNRRIDANEEAKQEYTQKFKQRTP